MVNGRFALTALLVGLLSVACGASEKERVAMVAAAQAIRQGRPVNGVAPEYLLVLQRLGEKAGEPGAIGILDAASRIVSLKVSIAVQLRDMGGDGSSLSSLRGSN